MFTNKARDVYAEMIRERVDILALANHPNRLRETYESSTLPIGAFLTLVTELVEDCERCSDCHEPEWSSEGFHPDDGFVCSTCHDENYFCCEHCGNLRSFDTDYESIGDELICRRCVDYHYYWCEECEEYDRDSHDHEEPGCECEAPHLRFRFPANGAGTIRNDERLSLELPAGTISEEGIKAIYDSLLDALPGTQGTWDILQTLEPVWQTKRGNYTRRLSTALHKKGVKIPPEALSHVGNVAREHSSATSAYEVEVTRNLNLPAEAFYHDSSCWWQSYFASRCALKNWGGIGLRTFDSYGNVSGRAWVQPLNENLEPTHESEAPRAYVVYNGYGDLEGYAPARIVAHLTGMTYRKVSLRLDPQFVNSSAGYLVSDQSTCENTPDISYSANKHATLDSSDIIRKSE